MPKVQIKILDQIRSVRKGEIGIHAHDNMEKALSNSLTAIDNGATWVDATVNGRVEVQEMLKLKWP